MVHLINKLQDLVARERVATRLHTQKKVFTNAYFILEALDNFNMAYDIYAKNSTETNKKKTVIPSFCQFFVFWNLALTKPKTHVQQQLCRSFQEMMHEGGNC